MENYAEGSGYIRFREGTDPETIFKIRETFYGDSFETEEVGAGKLNLWYYENYCRAEVLDALNSTNGYIEEGFLDFDGENNEHWRFRWDGDKKKWRLLQGLVVYEASDVLSLNQIGALKKAVFSYLGSEEADEEETGELRGILGMLGE